MAKEYINGRMEATMMENGYKIWFKEKVIMFGLIKY